MHFFINILPYLFLLHSHYSQATPIAQGDALANPCVIGAGDLKGYTITEQKTVDGKIQQLPFVCEPNTEGHESMLFCCDQAIFLVY